MPCVLNIFSVILFKFVKFPALSLFLYRFSKNNKWILLVYSFVVAYTQLIGGVQRGRRGRLTNHQRRRREGNGSARKRECGCTGLFEKCPLVIKGRMHKRRKFARLITKAILDYIKVGTERNGFFGTKAIKIDPLNWGSYRERYEKVSHVNRHADIKKTQRGKWGVTNEGEKKCRQSRNP